MVWKHPARNKNKKKDKKDKKKKEFCGSEKRKLPKELKKDHFKNKKPSSSHKEQNSCKIPTSMNAFLFSLRIGKVTFNTDSHAKVRPWPDMIVYFCKMLKVAQMIAEPNNNLSLHSSAEIHLI